MYVTYISYLAFVQSFFIFLEVFT